MDVCEKSSSNKHHFFYFVVFLIASYTVSMADKQKIELISDISQIGKLNSEMEMMLAKGLILKEQFFNINLVLEEIFTNIVCHGCGNCANYSVDIEFVIDDKCTEIRIIDNARQFNPLEAVDPNLLLPAEEREIGGLGIFLVKQLMDMVTYDYVQGKNVLTLKKFKPL